jgi:hypothetical protein
MSDDLKMNEVKDNVPQYVPVQTLTSVKPEATDFVDGR